VKRRKRRICDLPNEHLAEYAVRKVAPDVKFTQTDFLVQNSSPPLMIVNFLFCDAYFHNKKNSSKVLVNSLQRLIDQSRYFMKTSWPFLEVSIENF